MAEAAESFGMPSGLSIVQPGHIGQALRLVHPIPSNQPEVDRRGQRAFHSLSGNCVTLTPSGNRSLNELAVGDLVLTRDQGFRPIRWIGRKQVTLTELSEHPQFAPVKIAAGALDGQLPSKDMLVSPQHRILVWGPDSLAHFGEHEVLVPAIHLVGLPGITRHRPEGDMSYIQLLFEAHQVIRCDGTWCESFQPSKVALASLEEGERNAVLNKLATGLDPSLYAGARRSLVREESRLLFARD